MHLDKRWLLRIVLFFFSLILTFDCPIQSAVGQVWTGASTASDLWSDDLNWDGGVAPVSGTSSVLFNDPTQRSVSNQDLGTFTSFFQVGQLEFDTGLGSFDLVGNRVVIENQLFVSGGNDVSVSNFFEFANGASFNIADDSVFRTTSVISSQIASGPTAFEINGSGQLVFGASAETATTINVASGVTTVFDNCGPGLIFIREDSEFNGETLFRDSEVAFSAQQTFNNDVTFEAGTSSLLADVNASIFGTTTIQSGASVELFSNTGNPSDNIGIRGPGSLIVESGAELEIGAGVSVSKDVQIDDGGRLLGFGEVEGSLAIFGLLDPGTSIGTLTIDGDVDLFETTTTCIELAGSMSGEFDLIAGIGEDANNIMLDGTLEVSFLDGFVPDETDEFSFVTGFNITGVFSNTIDGGSLLSFTAPNDSFGTLVTSDGTFTVEYGADFVRLFGFQAAVPEPGSAALISMAIIGIAIRRRKI